MISISVVIPTYDRPALLQRAIASVRDQSQPASEVIVVDNGTTRVEKGALPDSVRLVSAPVRAGASQARNIGATVATGDFVAFLDDDDTWDQGYLAHITAAADGAPDAAMFAAALHNSETRVPIDGKNALGPFQPINLIRRNPGIVGSNIVVARQRFLNAGGFDVRLAASEDVDLVIRFVETGYPIVRVADAVAYYDATHEEGRLSEIGTLLTGKRVLVGKHVSHGLRRWALLADYAIRLIVTRLRV